MKQPLERYYLLNLIIHNFDPVFDFKMGLECFADPVTTANPGDRRHFLNRQDETTGEISSF